VQGAAFFVFFATATRAGIVAAWLWRSVNKGSVGWYYAFEKMRVEHAYICREAVL
jgi:hypothetical protein